VSMYVHVFILYACIWSCMHVRVRIHLQMPYTPILGDVDSLRRHLLASFSALHGGRGGGAGGGREDDKVDGHRRQAFGSAFSSSSRSSSSCLLIMGDSMMRQVCVCMCVCVYVCVCVCVCVRLTGSRGQVQYD
jgi:hypothetical protein